MELLNCPPVQGEIGKLDGNNASEIETPSYEEVQSELVRLKNN